MKLVIVTVGAVGAIVSGQASAQTVASNFNGPRVEGRIGWDRPTIKASETDDIGKIERSQGRNGASYGGEIGYDAAFNRLVVGGYAGFEASSAKYCGEIDGDDRGCIRAGRSIIAGGRLGFAASPSFMLYAKGGYSNTKAKLDYIDYSLNNYDFKVDQKFKGYHVGAGLEATLNGGIYGRLEYVYSSYGTKSFSVDDFDGVEFAFKPHRHQAVYAMGYRF